MNDTTIEWTEKSWNPVTGCSPVSEGCAHCYARRQALRLRGRSGYPADEPFRVTLHPKRLEEPLKLRKPSRIFVCSMGDLFHEDVDEKFIAKVFAIMDLARQHTYLVLTKRPARMQRLLSDEDFQFHVGWFQSMAVRELGLPKPKKIGPWPLRNVWAGVSVENQAAADERIPILLQILAAVRWVSCEPLLGPVDLMDIRFDRWTRMDVLAGSGVTTRGVVPQSIPNVFCERIDWVVVGGETGPGARPMHPNWVRDLRDQCQTAGVAFYFKSWGEWLSPYARGNGSEDLVGPRLHVYADGMGTDVVRVGRKRAGRLLDGRTWDEYPMRCERDKNAGAVGNE